MISYSEHWYLSRINHGCHVISVYVWYDPRVNSGQGVCLGDVEVHTVHLWHWSSSTKSHYKYSNSITQCLVHCYCTVGLFKRGAGARVTNTIWALSGLTISQWFKMCDCRACRASKQYTSTLWSTERVGSLNLVQGSLDFRHKHLGY